MTSITAITLDVADASAASRFYETAFGLDGLVRVREAEPASTGFRAYTLSIIVAQPGDAAAFLEAALASGATALKPLEKSLWGVGGVVRAPDGSIWKVATSAKKDKGPATKTPESVVLLIGADDVGASKRFYVDRGLAVSSSFGKYVQFALPDSPVGFGLYARRALAKDAGVQAEGSGSHRLTVVSGAGDFTDPDGFDWTSTGR